MPRKAAAQPATEGETPAPRRSTRISATAKPVELPKKKVAKPRKKKGEAEEAEKDKKDEAATNEEPKDKETEPADEPAPEVNGSKRKASEAPEGKPASKRVGALVLVSRVTRLTTVEGETCFKG